MNISSPSTPLTKTHNSANSAPRQPWYAATASYRRNPCTKTNICFVIALLVLSIGAPLSTAHAQECEPGALDYIVRDEKGKIFSAQALESIRKSMLNPAQEVGTVSVGKDGETYRSYQSEGYKAGRKIPALSYVDVGYTCQMKVPEATLTYRGKTMRLIFNVDIPKLPFHTLVIDSLPFQEGTFKLDLSRKRDGEFSKVLSARRWKKVSGKP